MAYDSNRVAPLSTVAQRTLGSSSEMVCGTGNGCLTMISWIDSLFLDNARGQDPRYLQSFEKAEKEEMH